MNAIDLDTQLIIIPQLCRSLISGDHHIPVRAVPTSRYEQCNLRVCQSLYSFLILFLYREIKRYCVDWLKNIRSTLLIIGRLFP